MRCAHLVFIFASLTACLGEISGPASDDPLLFDQPMPEPGPVIPSDAGEPVLLDGPALYGVTCSACHGALAVSRVRNKTKTQISMAMATVPAMVASPPVQALTPDQIEAIADALASGAASDGGTDSVPVATGLSYQAPIGNKFFMASKFKTLFARGNTTLNQTIDRSTVELSRVFGGVCNRTMPGCAGIEADAIGAQGAPTSNVLRAGYRIKTCEALLDQDLAVTNALQWLSLTPSSPRTAASLDAVAQLLTSATPGPAQRAALQQLDLGLGTEPAIEHWRLILVTLCSSTLFESF